MDDVRVAPSVGKVVVGAPLGCTGLTVNETVPKLPQLFEANPPAHARTTKRYVPARRAMRLDVEPFPAIYPL